MSRSLTVSHVACGVCDADDFEPFATGRDFEYGTSNDEFRMVRCLACGNVYLNPRPTADELPVIYPSNYYAYNYDTAVHPLALRAKEALDKRKVAGWLSYVPAARPTFLDVGCGNGRYLKMLHRLGVPKEQLYGVEMDRGVVDALRAEGYGAHYGRIEDVAGDLPRAAFDLIVLLQVVEHVESPRTMIATLAGLLAPGGVLVVETPNTSGFDARLFASRYWGGYHFPRHWNLLNEATLTRLAGESGLAVKAFNYLPAHSFWIYSLHHILEERWSMPRLARLFDPLRNLALLSLFTAFDVARARAGWRTSNIQMIAERPATARTGSDSELQNRASASSRVPNSEHI